MFIWCSFLNAEIAKTPRAAEYRVSAILGASAFNAFLVRLPKIDFRGALLQIGDGDAVTILGHLAGGGGMEGGPLIDADVR